MRKIFLCLLICLTTFSFSACQAKEPSVSESDVSEPDVLEAAIYPEYSVPQGMSEEELAAFKQLLAELALPEDSGGFRETWATKQNGNDTDLTTPITSVGVDEVDIEQIPLLHVELDLVKEINPDTVGWFYFEGPSSIYGLPVNNAMVKGTDNYYYLDRNLYNEWDINGSVYMDYRCSNNILENRNTVVYGHARSRRAFFGLKWLNNAERWKQDANNHFIKIQTDEVTTLWQVFSWYDTISTGNYTRIKYESDEDFISYAYELQSRNQIPELKQFEFNADSRILTLSTCKGTGNGRVAVHAILVKSEPIQK